MHKLLLTFVLTCFTLLLSAQRIQDRLIWDDEPTVVEWLGERRVEFAFTTDDEGGAAGAKTVGAQPVYLKTFNARPNAAYTVEVISTTFEPITAPRGTADLPTNFAFSVSVSRQPEGWLGKVSAPAMIRTTTGVQRLTSLDVRLAPAAAPNSSRPRTEFASNSVLRQGEWFRFTVAETGVHKLTRAFLVDELKVNLDGVDPRDIAIFGQTYAGKLPEITSIDAPDDLTELAVFIEGEADGNFDGGDFILFHAHGPDRRTYDGNADRFDYEKNIYATTNSYFIRIGGSRGRRVSQLPAASGGTATNSYDALYHFEEDKFNVLHELGGNAHGSGQSWYGDFFKGAPVREYANLFRVPDLVADEDANIRARMALRTDVSNRFALEIGEQRFESSIASRVRFGAQEQSPAVYPALRARTLPLRSTARPPATPARAKPGSTGSSCGPDAASALPTSNSSIFVTPAPRAQQR